MSLGKWRTYVRVTSVAILALVLTSPAWSQTDAARITGTVSDTTGAVIPGVTVMIKSEKTGEERTVTTNERGVYMATPLLPATYSVTARSEGLTPAEYKGIALQIGQEKTVNITMQVLGVATEVTVSGGDLTAIDTSSARVGVNVSEREVAQLPLNGRQISQLYLMAPGAVVNGAGTFDDVRFSGRANEQNAIRFDGVEGTSIVDASPGNLNGETSSSFRLQASMENVQEFRVESSNYPAEYGTGTGGQISIVTKSGSNAFHGSLFEYLRNDGLDARNFFDTAKSKMRLNQFGGSVGGPLKKDKAFFFASYEGLRQRTGIPFVETTPSASAWARAVPAIQVLRPAFPIGQEPSANPDFDVVRVTGKNVIDEDAGSLRLDYSLSDKYKLYARYFRTQADQFVHQNSSLSAYAVTAVPQNAVLSFQQILSPAIINETKFGYNGTKTRINGIAPTVPGVDLSGVALNLTGSVALSGIAGQAGSAGIAIPTGLVRANSATNGRGQPYTNYTLSFIDNLTVIHGSHTMKFGGEVRPVRMYTDRQGGTTYTFSNISSFLSNQPSSIQYLGDVSAPSPFNNGATGLRDLRQAYYVFFAQDEWKIRPALTINYGLRYEYYSVLHEAENRAVKFDMATRTIAPRGTPWYDASRKNFGPRLGISWSPDRFHNKTVFRFGGGLFYGPGQTEDLLQPAESDRISTTISSGPRLVFPLDIPAVVASYDINSPTLGFQPRAYANGYTVPERIGSYTASIQQEVPGRAILTVAYVGSQGRNLFLRSVTNKITGVTTNPTTGAAVITREFGGRFAEIDYKTSGGTNHYDSLQTTLNRRFSGGLTLDAQYTWSHNIGTSGGSNEARTAANNYSFAADRGDNNFDVRHSFNFTSLYEMPFGAGKRFGMSANPLVQTIFGNWQLGGVVNSRSGLPIEVLITRPDVVYLDNRNGTFVSNPIVATDGTVFTTAIINTPGGGNSRNIRRPDRVPAVDPILRSGGLAYLNPAAFAMPQPGTFGNLARNAFKGPHFVQLDFTLSKRFIIRESRNIEFRSEFYNIVNHSNFKNPASSLTNSLGTGNNQLQPGQPFTAAAAGGNFGVLTSTVSNQIGLGTNRQIQFSLRMNF